MSASAMPEHDTAAPAGVAAWARAVCAGLHAAGCRWVVYVPDNPLSHVLRLLADEYADVRTIVATREEEAFGIAAGLYLGGCRSMVMLQSSGLGNSLNTLGSLLVSYRIPVLMVMSMRGGPGEWNEAQVPVGRAVPAILDALGIQHTKAETLEAAESAVRLAASLAFGTRTPAACLLTRSLTATGHTLKRRNTEDTHAERPAHSRTPHSETRPGAPHHVTATPDAATGVGAGAGPRMTRLDATRLLVSRLRDEAVVATLGHPAYDLFAAGDRPANFYTWGSMGMASSIGLGIALARPERRVVVCDGDGSLLMNLGSLATIAVTRPANLTMVIWDNGEYGTTGGQKSATAFGADLAGVASALGIPVVTTVATREEFGRELDRVGASAGPAVVVAKVAESAPQTKPPLDCVFLKQRFMAALGSPEGATAGGTA
jgi:sulfopyruvate decarboxylase alpha subunit